MNVSPVCFVPVRPLGLVFLFVRLFEPQIGNCEGTRQRGSMWDQSSLHLRISWLSLRLRVHCDTGNKPRNRNVAWERISGCQDVYR